MDIKEIAKQFNIEVVRVEPVKSAVLSEVYVINNEFILRSRTLDENAISKFSNEQLLLNKVSKIIEIKLPNLLSTESGYKYFIDKNSLWTAYPLIKGEILCAWWNLEKLSEEQKKNVFVTLRELHSKTFGKLTGKIDNYDFIEDVTHRLSDIGNNISTDEFIRIQKAVNIVKNFQNNLQKQDICFIHGDYHPGNIIFKENEIIGLLDFDFSRSGSFLEDLAYTVMMFLRNYKQPFEFNEEDYQKFLNWYRVKEEDIIIFNEYLILYTFYDFHLFRDLKQLSNQDKFIEYQRCFLENVCRRF